MRTTSGVGQHLSKVANLARGAHRHVAHPIPSRAASRKPSVVSERRPVDIALQWHVICSRSRQPHGAFTHFVTPTGESVSAVSHHIYASGHLKETGYARELHDRLVLPEQTRDRFHRALAPEWRKRLLADLAVLQGGRTLNCTCAARTRDQTAVGPEPVQAQAGPVMQEAAHRQPLWRPYLPELWRPF